VTAKLYALIPRRPDISDARFHEHWRTTHADLARKITRLRAYVQSHRIPVDTALPGSPYEGIAEAYFDDAAAGLGMAADPEYTEHALKDEPNFMDMPGLAFLVTSEHVVTAGSPRGPEAAGVKLLQLFRRPTGSDVDRWRDDLRSSDQSTVSDALGAERHVLALSVPESYAPDPPLFDAVRELSWPDLDAYTRARDSSAWPMLVDADLMDKASVVADLAEENRVIWQDETT
jgi:uncharacterized protein (TIGR02118 family)